MNLKRLFEQDQKLRNKFKEEFLKPEFNLKGDLKAKPLAKDNQLTGIAFDYLMRFKVEYINKNKIADKRSWFADSCYEELAKLFFDARNSRQVWLDDDGGIYDSKMLLKSLDKLYERAKNSYANFIIKGEMTERLISTTLFLAKLDVYGRSGKVIPNFKSDIRQIRDLECLVSLVDDRNFTAKKRCWLNPTFSKTSRLIGADADIIIDNTLIELKVAKSVTLKSEYINQLLGYYLLSLVGGINGKKSQPIENLAIYFARHAELWKVPISDIASQQKFSEFKKEFVNYIQAKSLD